MTNERFFRMLSIALLGALALACVPDSQASSPQATALVTLDEGSHAVPIEIEIVREVDEINGGHFNPAVAGESKEVSSVVALSQFDPNLDR